MLTVVPESDFAHLKLAVAVDMGDGWRWLGTTFDPCKDAPAGFMAVPDGYTVIDRRDSDDVVQVKQEMRREFIVRLGQEANWARKAGKTAKADALDEIIADQKRRLGMEKG